MKVFISSDAKKRNYSHFMLLLFAYIYCYCFCGLVSCHDDNDEGIVTAEPNCTYCKHETEVRYTHVNTIMVWEAGRVVWLLRHPHI